MNIFDEKYDIRRLKYEEISLLQEHIRTNWKEDHIYVRDSELFMYEYVLGNRVNFVVAMDRNNNRIAGMIGYIPASLDRDHLDIWPTMWKVDENALPLLGVELYKRLYDVSGARNILGCGNNHNTSSVMLNAVMKYKNMKMRHYYRLAIRDSYKIAKIVHRELNNTYERGDVGGACFVRMIDSQEELIEAIQGITDYNTMPYKDAWYLIHRYMTYPIYDYQIWSITLDEYKAVLVVRVQEYKGENALRIVDYIGDEEAFSGLGGFFEDRLEMYEYIDMYEYGMCDDIIKRAGFAEITENDSNIIPNYFSPYEARNIDIWCSSRNGVGKFFKADGDQDRPN